MNEVGAQCGICTPGMIMAALVARDDPAPTLDDVKIALAGNLCRCTGYSAIYRAVMKWRAADRRHRRGCHVRTAISELDLRRASSVNDALTMLRDERRTPIAGATDLYVALNFGTLAPRTIRRHLAAR